MDQTVSFFVLPKFSDLDQLAEFFSRLCWYVSPFSDRDMRFTFLVDPALNLDGIGDELVRRHPPYFDQTIIDQIPLLIERSDFIPEDGLKGRPIGMNHVLLWNKEEYDRQAFSGVDYIQKIDAAVSSNQIPLHNFDVNDNPFERRHFIDCFDLLFGTYEVAANRDRFGVLCKVLSQRASVGPPVVIGRPPAQNEVRNLAQKTGIFICTNNAVYQDDIINADVPLVFTFMDAAMAGCSLFGAKFRERLSYVMKRENAWLLTWDIYEPYIAPVLSKEVRKRAVFMPRETVPFPCDDINADFQSRFVSSDSWNVATSLAVPLACSVFDRVHLYGLDGKAPTEALWSPTVPGKSDDATIQLAHPFGRRDISEKYSFHERTLAGLLAKALAEGKEVESLTPSHFTAVQALYVEA